MTTDNGGKNWRKTQLKLPAPYCQTLVPEVKDRLLLSCEGVSSDSYESTDLGKTWQHVKEHETF